MLRLASCAAVLLAACGVPQAGLPSSDPKELLKERPYALDAPADPTQPAPLLVVLHGQGGGGEEIAQDLLIRPLARTRGFWLAMPDGTYNSQRFTWWNATTNGLPPYDRIYLAALIDDVVAKHPVDPKRIYVVGYSIGAFMAHRLACDDSPKIAAIVSLAGAVATADWLCATTSPVSVVEVHGDRDDVITYDGGPFIGGVQSGPSAHDTVGVWARNDHCTGSLTTSGEIDIDPDTTGTETLVERYAGCPGNTSVELWTMRGVGHSPNLQPDFGTRLVDWLYAHPKP